MKRIFASFVFLLCTTFMLQAQTKWFVTPGAPTTGIGNAWATPIDLQTAINAASAGDSVFVAQGTYQPASGQSFNMAAGVKIYGGFAGTETSLAERNSPINTSILQGNGGSVIYNQSIDATAVLDGFTITGGTSTDGGGMHNFQASPTISNCVFSNNSVSTNGGAGGGMFNRDGSSPIISNCVFSGNTASSTGIGGGGAMFNGTSSPVINNCLFYNNTAAYAGAIYNYTTGASLIIKNTVFAGNISFNDGAAIGSYGNSLIVANSSFVNNSAGGGGGAIDNYGSSLTITNTIFWGNTANDSHKDIWLGAGPVSISYSFTQVSWAGTGNILGSSSPFMNAGNPAGADGIWKTADDGLVLQAGSPCINAGIPDTTGLTVGNTDFAGNARIVNSAIDMGAYEYDNSTLPIILTGFTGSLYNGVAKLQWQSETETSFNHFEVEKSTDGSIFRQQGEISAKGNAGNYTYSTLQQEQTAYYRLKLVDNDNSATYSSVLRLSQGTHNSILIYPSVATNHINIKVAQAGSISIYSADGKWVKTQAVQAGINYVDVSELCRGMYYGVVNGRSMKFIKE